MHKDRRETDSERYDRNWDELMQELRVTQTGVQILSGFLLTVPFQSRFDQLTEQQRMFYLALVSKAALATILLRMMIHRRRAGSGDHRRRRRRPDIPGHVVHRPRPAGPQDGGLIVRSGAALGRRPSPSYVSRSAP